MKSLRILVIFICALFTTIQIISCPTCIGKLDKNMPPFFTQEYDEYLEHYDMADEDKEIDTMRAINEAQK